MKLILGKKSTNLVILTIQTIINKLFLNVLAFEKSNFPVLRFPKPSSFVFPIRKDELKSIIS